MKPATTTIFCMYHHTDKTGWYYTPWLCYTSCGALDGVRNHSMGHNVTYDYFPTMRDWSNDPSHHEWVLYQKLHLISRKERKKIFICDIMIVGSASVYVIKHWLERKIAQWVHHEGLIQRSIAPRVGVLPQSYISLPGKKEWKKINICDIMTVGSASVYVIKYWLEREIAQWVHHEGLIQRSIAPRVGVVPQATFHSQERKKENNHMWHYVSWFCISVCNQVLVRKRNSSIGPPWGIDPMIHRTTSGCSTTEIHLTPRKEWKKINVCDIMTLGSGSLPSVNVINQRQCQSYLQAASSTVIWKYILKNSVINCDT